MAHTYTRLLVHVVFATKRRAPIITAEFKPALYAYMVAIFKNHDCFVHAIDGVADHCHVLIDLPARFALADVVRKVKANSSKTFRENYPEVGFGWQRGYGAFSLSAGHLQQVREYVLGQEEHHREHSLNEELERLLKIHGFVGDPEFIEGVGDE
ncbi:MAG: IS200/IS605 family transposase [Planctomycetes bacterium]|nr:IS200/IS605 family transposase [Planctomycetota bacterium]